MFSYYIIFHACICAYEAKWNKIIGVFAISAAVISSCPCHDWCYISVLFVQVIPKHWVYLAPILCYLFKNDLCVTFCSKANKHIMITSLFNLITRLDLNTSVWTTQPGLSISLIIRQDFITVEGMWAKFGPLEKLFRSEFELHYICLSSQIYGSLETRPWLNVRKYEFTTRCFWFYKSHVLQPSQTCLHPWKTGSPIQPHWPGIINQFLTVL